MRTSAEAKARILFAGCLLVLAAGAAAWWLLAAHSGVTYELHSREPVSGLIAGAPVEFHGVEVGRVTRVQLADPRTARVLIQVDKEAPVSTATVATITGRGLASRGFTGYVYVSLEDRDAAAGQPLAAQPGQPYPLIGVGPAQLETIDTAVHQMNQNVQAVSLLLQATFDPATVATMKDALTGLDQVTRTLAADSARLDAILTHAEHAGAQVQPLLQAGNATMRALQTQLLPRANAVLQGAQQAGTRLEPLLLSSQDAVWSLQFEVLPQAQQALGKVGHLAGTLDDTVGRIRRDTVTMGA